VADFDRRRFLKTSCAAFASLPVAACVARPLPVRTPYASGIPDRPTGTVVNDVHSQLNRTHVAAIIKPEHLEHLQAAVVQAKAQGQVISVAGGRHAMGGQQFAEGALLVDTRSMNRVLAFDDERGVINVEGGIQWPELIGYLNRVQQGRDRQWGIYQKQTGADRLSIAGALSCNAHGRGLNLKPIIQQVEAFDVLDADGDLLTCSRNSNPQLFSLAIGGIVQFSSSSDPTTGSRNAFAMGICTATISSRPMPRERASSAAACSRATSPCRWTCLSLNTRRASSLRTGRD
jgi:FAD/FMN-containing dehydrogenase